MAFESSVNALIDALAEPRPEEEADENGAKEYDKNIDKIDIKRFLFLAISVLLILMRI